jgi:hypothetical protein
MIPFRHKTDLPNLIRRVPAMEIEKLNRVRRTYTQTLVGPPERVFPLLCPVREKEWVPNWNPKRVLSASGVAERDGIFITEAAPHDAIWVITRHDAGAGILEMVKVTPHHTVCKLEIALKASGEQGTQAEIAYQYTTLGPLGEAFLKGFTEEWYRDFMKEWEAALNHYLTTGEMLATG